MNGDAAGELVLLTNKDRVEVYDSQGTKKSAFAFKGPPRTSPSSPFFGAITALRDGGGRFWIVFVAAQVKNTPSRTAIMRFLPDGTPDASFATAFLTGSTVAERMFDVDVQGSDLIFGTKTPSGYSYVRLE